MMRLATLARLLVDLAGGDESTEETEPSVQGIRGAGSPSRMAASVIKDTGWGGGTK